jgi:hypothetical protein
MVGSGVLEKRRGSRTRIGAAWIRGLALALGAAPGKSGKNVNLELF